MNQRLRGLIRAVIAIVVAIIVGQVAQLVLAVVLDTLYRADVTAGRWTFNSANVILIISVSIITGFTAGKIVKTHEKLVAATANFVPLIGMILLSIALNRDFLQDSAYDTRPALWVWIGFIPALIGGHLASRKNLSAVIVPVVMVLFYASSSFLHLWTAYIAYQGSGWFLALVTLSVPVGSEIYWFIHAWNSTGTPLNHYGVVCITVVLLGTLTMFLAYKINAESHTQAPVKY